MITSEGIRCRHHSMERTEGVMRPSALQRKIPCTMQLKELEEHGFVHKVIYPQVPPKVEYGLTEMGRSAIPAIGALGEWADAQQEPLREAITKRLGEALVRA